MPLARTTELEATNRVLLMMGEAPVNSLANTFGLAKQAHDMLKAVSRTVQSEGWSFNTDFEAALARNSSNEILINPSVSRVVVDQQLYPDYDITQRGNKLYDRKNQTFAFTQDLKGDITYMFDWDDLP